MFPGGLSSCGREWNSIKGPARIEKQVWPMRYQTASNLHGIKQEGSHKKGQTNSQLATQEWKLTGDLDKYKDRHIQQKSPASPKVTASRSPGDQSDPWNSCCGGDDDTLNGGPSASQCDATTLCKTRICFDFKSAVVSQCQIVMNTWGLGLHQIPWKEFWIKFPPAARPFFTQVFKSQISVFVFVLFCFLSVSYQIRVS